MTKVELQDFCLMSVNKSLDDCVNFKGISLLHYSSNFVGYDYGCSIHYYGKYIVVVFTCDGVDADTEYFEYENLEGHLAIQHFMDTVSRYESDLDLTYIQKQIPVIDQKEMIYAGS